MQTDEDYWVRLLKANSRRDGYWWYRDNASAIPEIVRLRFDEAEQEAELLFSFDYAEEEWCSVSKLIKANPLSQISVQQIEPPVSD